MINYIPLLIHLTVLIGFGLGALILSNYIGPKRIRKEKYDTYESGIPLQGNAKQRFNISYYVIAMLFVLFDVEAIFLYTWGVNFDGLGLFGVIEMFIFVIILVIGLIYVWKKGALEWE